MQLPDRANNFLPNQSSLCYMGRAKITVDGNNLIANLVQQKKKGENVILTKQKPDQG